jgi:hypothetical protein
MEAAIGHNSAGRTRCIFRAHGERAYTKLKNSFLQDRRISDETRGLIARLLSLPDDWEVTVQSIIASGKAGRDKVYRMLKEAEEFGYVRPEERTRADDGTLGRQLYLVSDDPEALIEKAALELYAMEVAYPRTGNPEVDEVVAEQGVPPRTAKPDVAKPRLAQPEEAEPRLENPTYKRNIEDKINIYPKDLLSDEQARSDPLPVKSKKPKKTAPDQYPHDFEEFWKVYPRREAKAEACEAWERLNISQKRKAYVALKAQIPVLEAKRRDVRGNFCPHPATWIRQGRFDDDPTEVKVRQEPNYRNGHYTGKTL